MVATLLTAAIFCSECSTDTSPSGNTIVGQQSSTARAGETTKKETSTSSEKEAPTQDGRSKTVDVSDYLIGYSQLANTGTCRITEANNVKDRAKKRGFKLIVTDAQDNTAKRISSVGDLIAQNIDLLISSPREFEELEMVLQTAKKNSVPVILIDRLTRREADVNYVMYIVTDFIWEGQAAEEWLKDRTGGTCNIIELTGAVRSSSTQDRATGFASVVNQNKGMKIIASQTGNFERSEEQRVVENSFQAHGGEVNAVFCHNDQMALGAVQAIEATGYKPNEDILVIGIDGEMGSFKSVITGEMSTTVVSSPMYGPITFDTVEKILAGQEVPEQTIMKGMMVDAENAQENVELAY